MVTTQRKVREAPIERPWIVRNKFEIERPVEIRYPKGDCGYMSLHDFITCVNRPHQEKFLDDIPGFASVYKGRIRGDFNLGTFLAQASIEEIDWLRQRMDILPAPKTAEAKLEAGPIQMSAAG